MFSDLVETRLRSAAMKGKLPAVAKIGGFSRENQRRLKACTAGCG
jgi:hypothetical protein